MDTTSPAVPPGFRAQLFALCLRALYGQGAVTPLFPLRVTIHDARHGRTVIEFSEAEFREMTTALEIVAVPVPAVSVLANGWAEPDRAEQPLGRIHRSLLRAIKDQTVPVPCKKLIKLAGEKYGSYARQAVTLLVRQRYLNRTPDGLIRGPRAPAEN